MFDSDEEALINIKPKSERVIPPSSQPIPENMERLYDSEEEYYFLRPKPKTESKLETECVPKDIINDIIKTKPITKPKTEDGR